MCSLVKAADRYTVCKPVYFLRTCGLLPQFQRHHLRTLSANTSASYELAYFNASCVDVFFRESCGNIYCLQTCLLCANIRTCTTASTSSSSNTFCEHVCKLRTCLLQRFVSSTCRTSIVLHHSSNGLLITFCGHICWLRTCILHSFVSSTCPTSFVLRHSSDGLCTSFRKVTQHYTTIPRNLLSSVFSRKVARRLLMSGLFRSPELPTDCVT